MSPFRAEAAGLDGLLDSVEPDRELLVFSDCLILLVILYRWGPINFWPDPEDIKDFDVIGSCLRKLRKRTGRRDYSKSRVTVDFSSMIEPTPWLNVAAIVKNRPGGQLPASLTHCV